MYRIKKDKEQSSISIAKKIAGIGKGKFKLKDLSQTQLKILHAKGYDEVEKVEQKKK